MVNLVVVVLLVGGAVVLWRQLAKRSGARSPRAVAREALARTGVGVAPDPVVLQRRTLNRMLEQVKAGVAGRPLCPTRFTIALAPEDSFAIAACKGWFSAGLVAAFRDRTKGRTPDLELVTDDSRLPGAPAAYPDYSERTVVGRAAPMADPSEHTTPLLQSWLTDPSGRSLRVSDGTVVGRDPGCTIVVDVPQVSRKHLSFSGPPGAMIVRDLGSTNGTSIDGGTVSCPTSIGDGAVLELGGKATFVFHESRATQGGSRTEAASEEHGIDSR